MSTYWRNYAEANLPSGTTQIFFSYWMYLPAGNQIPGGPSSPNWKVIWLGGPSHVQGSDLIVPIDMGGSYAVSCNVCPYSSSAAWLANLTFTPGTWHRVWAWIIGSGSGTGKTLVWDMDTAGVHQELNAVNTSNLNSGQWWDVFDLNGFGNQSASYPMFDDVYIATGANAAARVEIGNAVAYTSCTNLAVMTPTSWSDGSVTATVRQGSFKSGQAAYIYVTDVSGSVNAKGYPVTIGSGGSVSSPPPAPVLHQPAERDHHLPCFQHDDHAKQHQSPGDRRRDGRQHHGRHVDEQPRGQRGREYLLRELVGDGQPGAGTERDHRHGHGYDGKDRDGQPDGHLLCLDRPAPPVRYGRAPGQDREGLKRDPVGRLYVSREGTEPG